MHALCTSCRRPGAIARIELIVIDDLGLASRAPEAVRDLLEILDDRYDRGSALITSQEKRRPALRRLPVTSSQRNA